MCIFLFWDRFTDRQKPEVEVKDPIAARKFQKADREKLRRDRLNEQFLELGNALGKPLLSLNTILCCKHVFCIHYLLH